jgi:hypothetical protein
LIQIKAVRRIREIFRHIVRRRERRSVSYKDLLVVLDSEATARKRIAFAAALAERFSAHLIGLYPLPTRKRRGISGITIRRWAARRARCCAA